MNKKYAVKLAGGMGDIGAICFKEFEFDGSWFDSKEDAEKFKRQLEWTNKNTVYEIIKEGETMNQEEPVEQANKHRHPHADMIIEWAKDTSKVVEYRDDYPAEHPWVICEKPTWSKNNQYRFQPTKPERVFPTTSLREHELLSIYTSIAVKGTNIEAFKCIANAAIKQYILDAEKDNEINRKDNKGKQRIKSFGNSWEIIRKSQTVIFSGKSGEWWLTKPEGFFR